MTHNDNKFGRDEITPKIKEYLNETAKAYDTSGEGLIHLGEVFRTSEEIMPLLFWIGFAIGLTTGSDKDIREIHAWAHEQSAKFDQLNQIMKNVKVETHTLNNPKEAFEFINELIRKETGGLN